MTVVLLRTTIATAIAYAGAAIGVAAGRVSPAYLKGLVYAAMGVLLAVTVCDILPDAKAQLSWPAFFLSVGSGWALFWLFGKYVGPLCPACAVSGLDAQRSKRFGQIVVLLMLGLALHSTMDGLAVAVGDRLSGQADLAVMFAVSFHKFPEGMALAILLVAAGFTRKKALGWAWLIEATTEAGGLLGLFALRGASASLLGAVFGNVGGGFLYLILTTAGLFAHPHAEEKPAKLPSAPLLVNGSVAFALTAVLMWFFSHKYG